MADGFLTGNNGAPLAINKTLREKTRNILRQALVTGEIRVGTVYSAPAVAAQLGVSSQPVREAMVTLVSDGLMEPVRNRGYRVVPLSDESRRDIYQLRLMLEPQAMAQLTGQNVIDKRVGDQLRGLAEVTVDCARSGDLVGHLDSDRNFHLGLTQLLGNAHLTEIVMRLRDQTRRYSIKSMPPGELVANAEEHYALLDAVIAGNAGEAERVMVQHLSHLGVEPAGLTDPVDTA